MEGKEYAGHAPGIAMLVGGLAECAVAGLYHFKQIEFLIPMIAVAVITGIVCICITAMKGGGAGILSGICTMLILAGVCVLAIAGFAGGALVKEQIDFDKKAKAVTSETSGYIREFSLEGSDYWADSSHTKLVRIKRDKLMVEYEEIPITYDALTISSYTQHMSSFYLMSENKAFTDSYEATAFALWTGENTDQFVFRIKADDRIGYALIKITDFEGFIKDMDCVQYKNEYDGAVIFYLKPRTVFNPDGQMIDPRLGGYEVEYAKGAFHTDIYIGEASLPYIITTYKDSMRVSDVSSVKFDDNYDYQIRVNAFLSSHTAMRIEQLQKKLKMSGVSATDKKAYQLEIKDLQTMLETGYVELVDEVIDSTSVKLYRVMYDTSYDADVPNISVVELIFPDGSYKYGYTDLTLDRLHQLMPDRDLEAETQG